MSPAAGDRNCCPRFAAAPKRGIGSDLLSGSPAYPVRSSIDTLSVADGARLQ
jgi:hypothetical protein